MSVKRVLLRSTMAICCVLCIVLGYREIIRAIEGSFDRHSALDAIQAIEAGTLRVGTSYTALPKTVNVKSWEANGKLWEVSSYSLDHEHVMVLTTDGHVVNIVRMRKRGSAIVVAGNAETLQDAATSLIDATMK